MNRPIDTIIVNHNTRAELLACLSSLESNPPAAVNRIIVVDNASSDQSVEAVRKTFPAVEVIALTVNRGFGAANNVALATSSAEFVLFLNSDTVVPRGSIDTLHARALECRATAIGPKLVDDAGRPEVSFGPMLTPLAEWQQRRRVRMAASDGASARRAIARLVEHERPVDWVSGACLLVQRAAAVAAGGFDERYFLYEEDVDLCAALRARGGTVYFTPRAHVVHLRGRSVTRTSQPSGTASHYDRSHLAFYEKHAPQWAPWLRRWLRFRGRSI